jgi:hypothetical protein
MMPNKKRSRQRHLHTTRLVSSWTNTIASNRSDRQTRLQRAKEAAEARKIEMDDQERKFQKLRRQAQLAAASKSEFAQRPEVRAVHSQLLLHEV